MNPINLGIRFLLELAALTAMAMWGWQQSAGPLRFVLAALIPLIAAALWGIFAVPNDPSRSGKTIVATPGVLRLVLEIFFFTAAILIYFELQYTLFAWLMACTVLLHYLFSHKRVRWLFKQ